VPNAKYLQKEIDLDNYGLGKIIPLTGDEIISMGEEGFRDFLTPFLYKTAVQDDNIKFFDYLFCDDIRINAQMNEVFIALVDSLKILYRTNEISINESFYYYSLVVGDARIDRDNFDKLCEIIREMYFLNQPEEEENDSRKLQVSEANKAILEEYLRLEQEYKKEQEELAKKNQKSLHQIVTIVASQCLWDFNKVLSMSYYQMIVTFMSIFQIESYTTYLKYVTSGQFDMKGKEQKHLSEIVGK
jgi:hypothetical protein